MHAELTTIYQELKIATDMKNVMIELETKLLKVMHLIKNRDTFTHEYGVIIEDIRQFFAIL